LNLITCKVDRGSIPFPRLPLNIRCSRIAILRRYLAFGLPSGFSGSFEVFVGGIYDGSLGPGDTFEFPAGTTAFAISGISPLGEPFPLQLVFNTPAASFDVTVASVPEPSTWAMTLVGFAGLAFAGYRRTRVVLSAQ
jgi:PEP-CTERM motif